MSRVVFGFCNHSTSSLYPSLAYIKKISRFHRIYWGARFWYARFFPFVQTVSQPNSRERERDFSPLRWSNRWAPKSQMKIGHRYGFERLGLSFVTHITIQYGLRSRSRRKPTTTINSSVQHIFVEQSIVYIVYSQLWQRDALEALNDYLYMKKNHATIFNDNLLRNSNDDDSPFINKANAIFLPKRTHFSMVQKWHK